MIFIAGPVTHTDKAVEAQRVAALKTFGLWLRETSGQRTLVPAPFINPIYKNVSPKLGSFLNTCANRMCSSLAVLKAEGWDKSTGLADEIAWFMSKNKPVIYYKPDGAGGYKRA